MSMAGNDIPEKNTSSVNGPASGTYGEKADLTRLQASLPAPGAAIGSGSEQPSGVGPMATAPPRPPGGGPSPIDGLPAALFSQPTTRPYESVTAQPTNPPQPSATSGQQQRLAVLDALANDPSRAPETRQWAAMMLRQLIG